MLKRRTRAKFHTNINMLRSKDAKRFDIEFYTDPFKPFVNKLLVGGGGQNSHPYWVSGVSTYSNLLRGEDAVVHNVNLTDCSVVTQNTPIIGRILKLEGGAYSQLDNYDASNLTSNISSIYIPPEETTLQIGTNSGASSSITLKTTVEYGLLDSLSGLRMEDASSLATIDSLLEKFSAKSMELGAVQNRVNSALDEISTQYENLVSSRSTLQDAYIAEVSSEYIRQQILQQASATLMSTANQSASIALSLI